MKFTLQSKDVLHDFWVPAFRMKKDAVPGIDIDVQRHAEPRRRRTRSSAPSCAGSATPRCARPRTCRAKAEFDAVAGRRARQRAAAAGHGRAAAGGGATPDGKALFTSRRGCGGCHTLADAGASGTVGPDLDTVLKGKDAAFIKDVDRRPERGDRRRLLGQRSCPRNFGQTLRPAELDALVKYLSEVTKGG